MPLEPIDTRSDEDLMSAIAEGQHEALGELVTRHQASIFRLASAVTRDSTAAEDVLQDTFLAVLRSATTYRAGGTVKSWLFAIARRAAWKVGRGVAIEKPCEHTLLEDLGRAAGWGQEGGDAESIAVANEARRTLRDAFETLSADDREVLVLRDLEGLANEEAARVLGIDVPAVKSRIHRARLRLQAACLAGKEQP